MRTRFFSILASVVALFATTSDTRADVIFDNLSPTGTNVFFNSGVADINPSRYLLGEDITSTLALPSNATSWRLDSVDFNLFAHGNGTTTETFSDVMVEVTLWGDITGTTGNDFGASFAAAPVLGSEVFSLGDVTTGVDGGSIASTVALDFTNQIDIGDGQNIGITFELFDAVTAPLADRRSDRLSVGFRNGDDNSPLVGSTTDRLFRERGGALGVIDGTIDDFSFGSDAGLRFSLEATAVTESTAVPEPTSFAVLGIFGLGLAARRRR